MTKKTNIKRSQRIRTKLKKINSERFRLTIFRSLKNISAQIIDDKNKKTLLSSTTNKKSEKGKKKNDISIYAAESLAKKAKDKDE